MRRSKKQQPGVVLLLALLLLAAVTASTIGTAVTISQTTGQSTNLDNFIIASFAGDAGIERALAIVKTKRKADTITNAISGINTALATANNVGTTTRGQFLGTARTVSDPITIPILKPNESSSFDVLEYCQVGDVGCTVGQLKNVTAKYLDIKGVTTNGALELSWILLDQNGDSSCTGRKFITTDALNLGTSPYLLDSITGQLGEPCTEVNPKGFRIKVRALDAAGFAASQKTISNLVIEAYPCDIRGSGSCAPSGLPGRIQIDVTGNTGNSKAVKTVSVLWQLPASGLFNYVIFTEGDIIPN